MEEVEYLILSPEKKEHNNDLIINSSELHKIYNINSKRSPIVLEYEYGGLLKYESVFSVILKQGKVLGTQGMIPIIITSDGKEYLTGKSETTLIDETIRGKGYFSDFYELSVRESSRNGMVCLWGFTKALKALKRVKFTTYPGAMKWCICPIRKETTKDLIKNIYKDKHIIVKGIIISLMYSYLIYVKLLHKRKYKVGMYVKSMKNKNDLILFYKRLLKRYSKYIYITPNNKFINWRINNNPSKRIITEYFYRGDQLYAYLFYSIENNVLRLISFHYLDDEYSKMILGRIIQLINYNKIGFVFYTGNFKNRLIYKNMKLLKKIGFNCINRSSTFIYRDISGTYFNNMNEIKNWLIDDLWMEEL